MALEMSEALPTVHVTNVPAIRKMLDRIPGMNGGATNGFGRGKATCKELFCNRDDILDGVCKMHRDIAWHKQGRDAYHAEAYGNRASKVHRQATANDTMQAIRNGEPASHRAPLAELVAA
jgi:hypothetical protein